MTQRVINGYIALIRLYDAQDDIKSAEKVFVEARKATVTTKPLFTAIRDLYQSRGRSGGYRAYTQVASES